MLNCNYRFDYSKCTFQFCLTKSQACWAALKPERMLTELGTNCQPDTGMSFLRGYAWPSLGFKIKIAKSNCLLGEGGTP